MTCPTVLAAPALHMMMSQSELQAHCQVPDHVQLSWSKLQAFLTLSTFSYQLELRQLTVERHDNQ